VLDLPEAQSSRRRAWLSAALLCAALLFLPALVWIIVPRPGGFAPPPPPKAQASAEAMPAAAAPAPVRVGPRPAENKPASTAVGGEVTGMVLDPDGKPVNQASVGCDDRDQTLITNTGPDGRFRLPPEASGCLAVAHHPDFTPAERMAIVAGQPNVFHLKASGGIAGVVVDEKGNPLSPYILGVESFAGTGEAAETVPPTGQPRTFQDAKGAFLWEGLMPGKYVLTASADGRPPTRSSQIEVEAGRVTRHVRIVLPRGSVLSGKIIDAETRKPVAGAVVALDAMTQSGANAINPSRSDENGVYTLDGAPPGPFSIRVAHEKYRTRTVSGLTTRGGAPSTQDVELTPRGDGGANDEMAGIGAILVPQPKGVIISFALPGGPADGAGLRVGDMIQKIDGLDAQGLTMSDCIQRLRGPEGSRVLVAVAREGEGTVEVLITRKNIVR
jgi:Carboxypeptidase regulatory-like domain/PDZ domain